MEPLFQYREFTIHITMTKAVAEAVAEAAAAAAEAAPLNCTNSVVAWAVIAQEMGNVLTRVIRRQVVYTRGIE